MSEVPESVRGKTRSELGQILNDAERVEKIRILVDQVLDLQGLVDVYCPNCRKKLRAETPDLKGRVDGLIKLLEQAEGKPQDLESGGVTIVVERVWPSADTDSLELQPAPETGGVPSLSG